MDAIILKSFIPEIFFSLCILIQLVFNARLISNSRFNFPIIDTEVFSQTLFILVCLFFLLSNVKIEGYLNNFLFLNDHGGNLLKCWVVITCILSLSIISRSAVFQKLNFFEFFTIFSLSIFSLLLLISSYDFISSYLVIEMQALCFYILASFRRNSAFSTEAGLKYFISGSFISGIFLFGCSLLYGSLGTLNFNNLSILLSFPLENELIYIKYMVVIGILFIFVTLFFKIAVVPFHFWSPDVYEGAPLSSTIIFSIVPKIVIFNFLIKCISAFSNIIYEFQFLFLFSGVLSVFVGTFFAIRQKRLKRLVIYSSIAQVGFLVAALATNTVEGFGSIYFFLFIYTITAFLTWGYIVQFYGSQIKVNNFEKKLITPIFLSNLSNFFKLDKMTALSFVLIFFSVAGIPPLSGFLSKIFILLGLVESNLIISSGIIVIISAISVFYYLRIVKIVFFETKDVKMNNQNIQTFFPLVLNNFSSYGIAFCLYLLLFFFFFPDILILGSQYIVLSTFGF